MAVGRRGLAGMMATAAAASGLAGPAKADPSTAPNVIVFCDPPLRAAMIRFGRHFTAATRVPVNVFCAPPPLMLAQIERRNQNDILITLAPFMDEAARRHLVAGGTFLPMGVNAYVFATREADQATIVAGGKLPFASLVVPDRTAGTTLDAQAVLGGSLPPDIAVIGAVDTEQAAAIVRHGAAEAALVYRTEAQPGSGLRVAGILPGRPPSYEAAVTAVSRSPRVDTFITYLRSPEARDALRSTGLDVPA